MYMGCVFALLTVRVINKIFLDILITLIATRLLHICLETVAFECISK